MLSLSVISFALLAACVSGSGAPRKDCPVTTEFGNQCVAQIYLFADKQGFIPRTEADMDKYCTIQQKALDGLKEYTRCLSGFTRQMFTIYYKSNKEEIKERCGSKERRQKFAQYWSCIHKKPATIAFHTYDYFITKGVVAAYEAPTNRIFPYFCCALKSFDDEIAEDMTKLCNQEASDYIMSGFGRGMKDVMDVMCGDYASKAKCEEKAPDIMAEYEKLKANVVPQNETLVSLTLVVLDKMVGED